MVFEWQLKSRAFAKDFLFDKRKKRGSVDLLKKMGRLKCGDR